MSSERMAGKFLSVLRGAGQGGGIASFFHALEYGVNTVNGFPDWFRISRRSQITASLYTSNPMPKCIKASPILESRAMA